MRTQLTIRGSFMYPRHAPADLWRMIVAGLLDLSALRPHVFALDDVDRAIAQAATVKGFEYCVLAPTPLTQGVR